jgi:hypothetical protein
LDLGRNFFFEITQKGLGYALLGPIISWGVNKGIQIDFKKLEKWKFPKNRPFLKGHKKFFRPNFKNVIGRRHPPSTFLSYGTKKLADLSARFFKLVGGGKIRFFDFKAQNLQKLTYCVALDPGDSNLYPKIRIISKYERK